MSETANNDGGGTGKVSNPKDVIGDTKVPLWLLSTVAKIHWALAQFAGMLKYGAWNWRVAGVRASVYISAIERHLEGYKSGEDLDPVDGTKHLGNIMACSALLMDAEAADKLTDDRPPRVDHRPTIAAAEAQMAVLKERYKDRNPKHYSIGTGAPQPVCCNLDILDMSPEELREEMRPGGVIAHTISDAEKV